MNNKIIKLDNCVISSDGTTLIDIDDDVTELILPYNINRIYKVQCVQKKLKTLDCPNVIEINHSAFSNQYNLEYINLPKCRKIGKYAFNNCINLKSIYIPNVEILETNAFFDCHELEFIEAPNLQVIENSTFYNCKNLKYIKANNLTTLYPYSLNNCDNLYYINCLLSNENIMNAFGNKTEQYQAYQQRNRDYKLKQLINKV